MSASVTSVLLVVLLAVTSYCHAYKLTDLHNRVYKVHKNTLPGILSDGNPCPEAEKPFPCKSTPTCIPMGYLCDYNTDCEDGYDEDPEVCTAAHRPPVGDILNFLKSTKSWSMDKLFARKNIIDVAHALAVSPTVDNFQRRLDLSPDDVKNLKVALQAVASGNEAALAKLGMPPSDWNEVSFMFAKLIKSGFAA